VTIFIERLQATVGADISDAVRKLAQVSEAAKKAKREMSGTATLELRVKQENIKAARAELEAAIKSGDIEAIARAKADLDSAIKAHEELRRVAGEDIHVDVKARADTGSMSHVKTLLGGLAGITGLSLDAKMSPNITMMASQMSAIASIASAATAGVAGLGGALLAAVPSTLAMGGAMAALVPAVGAGLLAFHGIGDAMGTYNKQLAQGATPAAAFAKATKGMDAEQKNFLKTLISLEQPLKKMQEGIQKIVLPAATQFLNQMGKVGLPLVNEGLTGAAQGLAQFIRELGNMLSRKDTLAMFHSLNQANTEMIKNWGGAGVNVIHTFITGLYGVRGTAMDVTKSILDSTGQFDKWVTSITKSGQLAQVVAQSYSIFKNILDGLGDGIAAIAGAIRIGLPGLQAFSEAFRGLFEHIRNSVKPGADAIKGFFGDVGRFGGQLSQAIQSLGPGLAKLVEALGKLASTAVGPALMTIAPALSAVAQAIGGMLPAFQAFIKPLGDSIAMLGYGLANALKTVTPMLTNVAGQIGQNLFSAVSTVAPMLGMVAGAFVNILNTLSPVIPLIGQLAKDLLPAFNSILNGLNGSINNVMPSISSIVDLIGKALAQALDTVAPLLPDLGDALNNVLQALQPLIPLMGQLLASFGTALITGVTNLLNALTPLLHVLVPVATAIGDVANAILKIPGLGGIIASFTLLTGVIGKGFVGSLITASRTVGGLAGALKGGAGITQAIGAVGGFTSALSGIGIVAATALPAVIMGVTGVIHWLNRAEDAAKKAGKAMADDFIKQLQTMTKPGDFSGQEAALKHEVDYYHQQNIQMVQDAQRSGKLMGVPADALNEALHGNMAQLKSYYQQWVAATSQAAAKAGTANVQLMEHGKVFNDMLKGHWDAVAADIDKAGTKNNAAMKELQKQIKQTMQDEAANKLATEAMYNAMGVAAGYTGNTATKFGELSTKLSDAKQKLSDINQKIDDYLGKALGMAQSTDSVYQNINSFTDGLKDNGAAMVGNTKNALANREGLNNIAQSIIGVISNLKNQGATSDTIKQKVADFTNSLYAQAGTINKNLVPQIEDYLKKLGLTPDQVATTLKVLNYTPTVNQIGGIQSQLNNLAKSYTVSIDINGHVQNFAQVVATQGYSAAAGQLQTAAKAAQMSRGAQGLVTGGFKTTNPALVGEDKSGYPEYVIPTNPSYRKNALKLLNQLVAAIGMAQGGVVSGSTNINLLANAGGAGHSSALLAEQTMNGLAAVYGAAVEKAHQALLAQVAASGGSGGGSGQWAGVAAQVAAMLGQAGSVGAILRRIQMESGGNPTAVNLWDSNAAAGHPSVGLAQVIAGTFQAYAGPFAGTGPFMYGVSVDPLANVFAGMNYATHAYGSIAAVDPLVRSSGYDQGGMLLPGVTVAVNNTGKPEYVSKTPPININVDARGSTNPAAPRQEVVNGIQQMLPVLTQHLNR